MGKSQIPMSVMNAGSNAIAIFNQSIAAGSDVRFAEMCALRSPPGTRFTDRAADQGIHEQMSKVSPINQKMMLAAAKKAGINTAGKVHKGMLGGVTNPLSWVSCADDIRRSAEIQGLDVDGVIRHKAAPTIQKPAKRVKLAPDILKRLEASYLSKDASLREKVKKNPKARGNLREMIVEKHGAKSR